MKRGGAPFALEIIYPMLLLVRPMHSSSRPFFPYRRLSSMAVVESTNV